MRKIIIIGTIHSGFTPNKELEEVLEKYHPKQLFVEIAEEDVTKNKLKNHLWLISAPTVIICSNKPKIAKLYINSS